MLRSRTIKHTAFNLHVPVLDTVIICRGRGRSASAIAGRRQVQAVASLSKPSLAYVIFIDYASIPYNQPQDANNMKASLYSYYCRVWGFYSLLLSKEEVQVTYDRRKSFGFKAHRTQRQGKLDGIDSKFTVRLGHQQHICYVHRGLVGLHPLRR